MYRSQRAGSVVRAAKEIVPTRGSVRTSLQSDTKVCHVFFCVMRTFGVAIRVGPPRPQRGSAPAPQFSPSAVRCALPWLGSCECLRRLLLGEYECQR